MGFVLIIESDDEVRSAVHEDLAKSFEVPIYAEPALGDEILANLEQAGAGVVIFGLTRDDPTGGEAIAAIRARSGPGGRILLLCDEERGLLPSEAKAAGADDVLRLPINLGHLRTRVGTMLEEMAKEQAEEAIDPEELARISDMLRDRLKLLHWLSSSDAFGILSVPNSTPLAIVEGRPSYPIGDRACGGLLDLLQASWLLRDSSRNTVLDLADEFPDLVTAIEENQLVPSSHLATSVDRLVEIALAKFFNEDEDWSFEPDEMTPIDCLPRDITAEDLVMDVLSRWVHPEILIGALGGPTAQVHVPEPSPTYRISSADLRFLRLLDGRTSFAQAQALSGIPPGRGAALILIHQIFHMEQDAPPNS